MGPTYAYSSWLFTRAISLVYLIAFLSLMVQAKGLWGSRGVLPIAQYMKAVEQSVDNSRYWKAPGIFWLSSSNDMIVGVTITGAVAATLALIGFAQGWSLLLCFAMYLSLCSFGQDFMSFQWDALLLELGFLVLFLVPWNFDFSLARAVEPHWVVRGMFYVVLFKLMFLSGFVKLWSGDESWRDLSALSFHYWTQPLPNPLSPFMHALPSWLHQASTAITFVIELIVPFFIFWPRARVWVAAAFAGLSLLILLTGNFAFFNWLTLALCLWLVPDRFWEVALSRMPFELTPVTASMFPHPITSVVMGALFLLSVFWCVRFWLPDFVIETVSPVINYAQSFHISNPYGLFAVMTKSRPEIVIEGSIDGKEWKEYAFKFKPGPLDRMPPIIAPYQPRLDWQMWFAALSPIDSSPWIKNLMFQLLQNSPDVTGLLETNPFEVLGPKFIRAKLYSYEFTTPEEITESGTWWKRTPMGDYSPVFTGP